MSAKTERRAKLQAPEVRMMMHGAGYGCACCMAGCCGCCPENGWMGCPCCAAGGCPCCNSDQPCATAATCAEMSTERQAPPIERMTREIELLRREIDLGKKQA